jgi:dextranase
VLQAFGYECPFWTNSQNVLSHGFVERLRGTPAGAISAHTVSKSDTIASSRLGGALALPAVISLSVSTNHVTYSPGDVVEIACMARNLGKVVADVTLDLEMTDPFGTILSKERRNIRLEAGGAVRTAFCWKPPPNPLAAYVARVRATSDRRPAATSIRVFDVVREWTAVPRYGFFAVYPREPEQVKGKLDQLAEFHINAIQFYDWFENHGDYLPQDEFYSILGKRISRRRVLEKISAAKELGMKAMAYTAIYSASEPVYEEQKESVLTDRAGCPLRFIDWLYFMNPERRSRWQGFLIDQLFRSTQEFRWDGIHLDQYGRTWTRSAYWQGKRLFIEKAFVSFINDLVTKLGSTNPCSAVVFNCVNAWPLRPIVKHSTSAFTYVEVWPPHDTYGHVQYLIDEARRYSRKKAVVLAAYCPNHLPTILLLDALIFSNRAFHIELGEGLGYLVDAYFPKYATLDDEAARRLRQYYETITRYGEYIYDDDLSNLRAGTVRLLGHPFSETPQAGRVLVRAYRKATRGRTGALVVNFVNFGNVKSMLWKSKQKEPKPAREITAKVRLPRRTLGRVSDVLCVTPDSGTTDPVPLHYAYEKEESVIRFKIPDFTYWELVVIRFA